MAELSARSRNILEQNGIDDTSQLLALTADQLAEFRGMGVTSVRDIQVALAKFGLALPEFPCHTAPDGIVWRYLNGRWWKMPAAQHGTPQPPASD